MIMQMSRVFKTGHSKGIILPKKLVTSEAVSLAAGRVLILDPEGRISPEKLCEFVKLVERALYADEAQL